MEEKGMIDSKVCKEIYVIFTKLRVWDKLPSELKEYIIKNQDLSYEFDFNTNVPLIYQVKNKKTITYISYLYLKYINDSESEKNMLLKKYAENEKKYQEDLRKKYNPDSIFKNKNKLQ